MKKSVLVTALLASFSVNAADFFDTGRVTQVTPVYQTVNQPVQSCQVVDVAVPQERSNVGAVIGGVAGAIIGSQVGGGTGQVVSGALGAGVGAIVGDRVDNRNNGTVIQQRQVCQYVNNYQNVVSGYTVSYTYQNRTYQTIMNSAPQVGDNIRVRVSVSPN